MTSKQYVVQVTMWFSLFFTWWIGGVIYGNGVATSGWKMVVGAALGFIGAGVASYITVLATKQLEVDRMRNYTAPTVLGPEERRPRPEPRPKPPSKPSTYSVVLESEDRNSSGTASGDCY